MAGSAVSLALHNEKISAEVVEANEFPDLAQRYEVYGVPRTVINERVALEGAVPEAKFVEAILGAVSPKRGAS